MKTATIYLKTISAAAVLSVILSAASSRAAQGTKVSALPTGATIANYDRALINVSNVGAGTFTTKTVPFSALKSSSSFLICTNPADSGFTNIVGPVGIVNPAALGSGFDILAYIKTNGVRIANFYANGSVDLASTNFAIGPAGSLAFDPANGVMQAHGQSYTWPGSRAAGIFHNDSSGNITQSALVESDLSLTDVTTANASITAHGFLPKLPNDSSKFLNGTGAFSTPTGGSVSSVGITGPAGVTWANSPITTSGTLTATTPGILLTNGEDQAVTISNTLLQNFNIAANTVAMGLKLQNPLQATSGNQGYSPALMFEETAFRTASVAGAKSNLFRVYEVGVQDTANPFGYLRFDSSTNDSTTFGYPIDFSSNGTTTNSGDVAFGTSGGSHYAFLIGPHAASGMQLSSDAPGTLGWAVNGTYFQVQINSSAKYQFNSTYLQPLTDNAIDLGQGSGASSRFRNVVISGAVTNDINGAGSGGSVTIPSGGGIAANTAGSDMKIFSSQATGTARSGAIITYTAPTLQSSGSSVNASVVRSVLAPKRVNLTESTATLVFNVSLASGKFAGIHVYATTQANDGTDFQTTTDDFSIPAVNKGGTVTTSLSQETVSAASTGTLTTTWTAVANGNGIDVKNNAVSSLTQTTLATYWRIEVDTDDTTLSVTPQ